MNELLTLFQATLIRKSLMTSYCYLGVSVGATEFTSSVDPPSKYFRSKHTPRLNGSVDEGNWFTASVWKRNRDQSVLNVHLLIRFFVFQSFIGDGLKILFQDKF